MRVRQICFLNLTIALLVMVVGCENKFNPVQDDFNEKELSGVNVLRSGILWDYPLRPGMEEWKLLETEQERIDALQVPEDILSKLSSDDIVRLCITFPSFGHFTAFNTPQDGFSIMLSRYNIFGYLLSQKDIGKSLIEAYKDADLSGFKKFPYSNEFWPIKLYYIELLLAQKEILQILSLEEKLELVSEAKTKFSKKIDNEVFSSLPGIYFSIRIIANILEVEEYPEFLASSKRDATTQLIQTGWCFNDVPPIEEIIKIADNYINRK